MKNKKRFLSAVSGLCLAASMLTGAVVQAEPLPPKQYDINGDGEVGVADAISLIKYLHGGSLPKNLKRADLDGDKQVDVFDLGLFLRLLVQSETINEETARELSAKYTAAPVETVQMDEATILGQTKFALELMQGTVQDGKNVLVSPYSVSQALGMTANGATGETRAEMETVLGGKLETLNPAFYTMRVTAPNEKKSKLSTANSIWIRTGYPVSSTFLQTNADYYGADAYSAPFDNSTIRDINQWVDKHTDHMIPTILDEQEPAIDGELCLVNAVAFDSEWMSPYTEDRIAEKIFTAADGKEQTVQMMHGESWSYLADEHATGFLNYYAGGKYAFAALLPEEGMTPEAYLEGLTAEGLHKMLAKPERAEVRTGLPEFKYDFGTKMKDTLSDMGMATAFSPAADFSGMTDGPNALCIDEVIHKTFIEVTPMGTRAGAATAVIMKEAAVYNPEEPKEVILDRPFVYMIVDTENNLPIFFGTVNSISN